MERNKEKSSRRGAGQAESREVDLVAAFRLLRRTGQHRWRLILLLWVLFTAPAVVYAITAVPTYTAIGVVQVSQGGGLLSEIPLGELAGSTGKSDVQTEVEIIRRRQFVREVLAELRLNVVDDQSSRPFTFDWKVIRGISPPTSSELEMLRASLSYIKVRDGHTTPVRILVSTPGGEAVRVTELESGKSTVASPGGLATVGPVQLRFTSVPILDAPHEFTVLPAGALEEQYADQISVAPLGNFREPTNLVQVGATLPDSELARVLALATMEHYVDQSLRWQNQSAAQAVSFIEAQLDEVRSSLTESERALQTFSEKQGAVQLETQAEVQIRQLAELEAQRIAIELEAQGLASARKRVSTAGKQVAPTMVTTAALQDPTLLQGLAALAEAQTHYLTLKAEFTPEHPHVRYAADALEQQRDGLIKTIRSSEKSLAERKKRISSRIEAENQSLLQYPETQLELARLMREVEVGNRLYTLLLEKREEAEILRASTTTDKRIVDTPATPHKKTSPQRSKIVGAAAVLALLLALALATLYHVGHRKVSTAGEIVELVPYSTYASIPVVHSDKSEPGSRLDVSALWTDAHSQAAEAFRSLAVSVSLVPGDRAGQRVILLVSSSPGEGKSTVASNLAVALGRAGRRTLLLDLDLRRPVQHRQWRLSRAPGFSDMLATSLAEPALESAIRRNVSPGVDVLTAGTPMPDSAAAILSPKLPDSLSRWCEKYDFVIIDSPPLFVAETAALTRVASLALLVARPGRTERASIAAALEVLGGSDCAKGLVLNGLDRITGGDYYYYSNSRYYAAEQSTEEQVASTAK